MRSAVCYHTYPIATLMIPLTHLITSSHPFLAHLWPFRTRTASCSWAPGSVSSWLNWMDHASERFMFRVSESLPSLSCRIIPSPLEYTSEQPIPNPVGYQLMQDHLPPGAARNNIPGAWMTTGKNFQHGIRKQLWWKSPRY